VITFTDTPIHVQQPGWLVEALKQAVFSVYDTLLISWLLEVVVGLLVLTLGGGWLWLVLNWLAKKRQPPSGRWDRSA
jgi:hypothetical protein